MSARRNIGTDGTPKEENRQATGEIKPHDLNDSHCSDFEDESDSESEQSTASLPASDFLKPGSVNDENDQEATDVVIDTRNTNAQHQMNGTQFEGPQLRLSGIHSPTGPNEASEASESENRSEICKEEIQKSSLSKDDADETFSDMEDDCAAKDSSHKTEAVVMTMEFTSSDRTEPEVTRPTPSLTHLESGKADIRDSDSDTSSPSVAVEYKPFRRSRPQSAQPPPPSSITIVLPTQKAADTGPNFPSLVETATLDQAAVAAIPRARNHRSSLQAANATSNQSVSSSSRGDVPGRRGALDQKLDPVHSQTLSQLQDKRVQLDQSETQKLTLRQIILDEMRNGLANSFNAEDYNNVPLDRLLRICLQQESREARPSSPDSTNRPLTSPWVRPLSPNRAIPDAKAVLTSNNKSSNIGSEVSLQAENKQLRQRVKQLEDETENAAKELKGLELKLKLKFNDKLRAERAHTENICVKLKREKKEKQECLATFSGISNHVEQQHQTEAKLKQLTKQLKNQLKDNDARRAKLEKTNEDQKKILREKDEEVALLNGQLDKTDEKLGDWARKVEYERDRNKRSEEQKERALNELRAENAFLRSHEGRTMDEIEIDLLRTSRTRQQIPSIIHSSARRERRY
jgi:hypothetical protein